MARVSVTVSTIDGATPSKTLQSVDSKDVMSLVSADNLTTGLAHLEVRRWDGRSGGATARIEKWVSSSSYATVQAAINAADAEAGAQLTSEKDASGGYVGLTLRKINFYNVLGSFLSWFTNSNTAARTYTFQDRDGTIADDTDLALKAPLASPTFTGVPAMPTAATSTSTTQGASTAFVQANFTAKIAKLSSTALVAGSSGAISNALITANSAVSVTRLTQGGTFAPGGYEVALNAGVGYTITARKVDGTLENACTDTVCATIVY